MALDLQYSYTKTVFESRYPVVEECLQQVKADMLVLRLNRGNRTIAMRLHSRFSIDKYVHFKILRFLRH